jgi:hypothetical protein
VWGCEQIEMIQGTNKFSNFAVIVMVILVSYNEGKEYG